MFQNLTDVYDAMIDWPKRLAHEEPFYRRLFEQHNVQSVVDVACGTGRHAAMFHSWGLQVEASDLSPEMIDRARANFGEPAGLRWAVRGFDRPIAAEQPFDAVVCVGNSLPLAPDVAAVQRAIEQMLAALRSGGLLVVHALNLWRLPDGPCVWQKCQPATLPQGEVLIIKGVHRCGKRGYVELIVAELCGDPKESPRPLGEGQRSGSPLPLGEGQGVRTSAEETALTLTLSQRERGLASMRTECTPLLGLEAAELETMAAAAGGGEIRFFGGYQQQPYDRQQSVDLVMVAQKKRL